MGSEMCIRDSCSSSWEGHGRGRGRGRGGEGRVGPAAAAEPRCPGPHCVLYTRSINLRGEITRAVQGRERRCQSTMGASESGTGTAGERASSRWVGASHTRVGCCRERAALRASWLGTGLLATSRGHSSKQQPRARTRAATCAPLDGPLGAGERGKVVHASPLSFVALLLLSAARCCLDVLFVRRPCASTCSHASRKFERLRPRAYLGDNALQSRTPQHSARACLCVELDARMRAGVAERWGDHGQTRPRADPFPRLTRTQARHKRSTQLSKETKKP